MSSKSKQESWWMYLLRQLLTYIEIIAGFMIWVYLDISYLVAVQGDVVRLFMNPYDTIYRWGFAFYTSLVLCCNVYWWFFISRAIKRVGKRYENKDQSKPAPEASGVGVN